MYEEIPIVERVSSYYSFWLSHQELDDTLRPQYLKKN